MRKTLAGQTSPSIEELEPLALLETIFAASTPYRFEAAGLSVLTDPRWFSTLPLPGVGAPALELRRWPGDSILALYAVAGPVGEGRPPLARARLEQIERVDGSHAVWQGPVETPAGERPAYWFEILVPGVSTHLAALLLPGDAGMGEGAVEELGLELRVVLGRVEVDAESWKRVQALPPGEEILFPETGGTPGAKSEMDEPWQVAQAAGFTMGLPPGFRTRRVGGGVPSPVELPGSVLWFRGRFEDGEGSRVIVGDGLRAGYVARVGEGEKAWATGGRAPLGAPEAKSVRSEAYPLAAERCGALSATAERWKEAGFDGDWLVFRLVFSNAGFEIGLPVVEGRRSASLFWIPASWRVAGQPPAPPPVDPAERFGIRFERLTPSARGDLPWMEGYLRVPGLSAEVPKGWFPAASLRSSNGYPISFLERDGTLRGLVTRFEAGEIGDTADGVEGWSVVEHAGRYGAAEAWTHAAGARLLVAKEGHAYLFEPQETQQAHAREAWMLMLESVHITRSGPRRKKNRN